MGLHLGAIHELDPGIAFLSCISVIYLMVILCAKDDGCKLIESDVVC